MKLRKQYKSKKVSDSFFIIRALLFFMVLFFNISPLNRFVENIVVNLEYPFVLVWDSVRERVLIATEYFRDNRNIYDSYVKTQKSLLACNSDLSQVAKLREENSALKEQLDINTSSTEFIFAKQVLPSKSEIGIMFLKTSRDDKVSPGDLVVEANSYVGKVTSVDGNISKVLLPIHRKSLIKVFISKSRDDYAFVGKGLAIGDGVSIKLSNIVGTDIKNGDWVFVAEDSNYWLLGSIDDLSTDPTSSSQTGVVQPSIDTLIYKTYFIYSLSN